jgi:hypothetical protein
MLSTEMFTVGFADDKSSGPVTAVMPKTMKMTVTKYANTAFARVETVDKVMVQCCYVFVGFTSSTALQFLAFARNGTCQARSSTQTHSRR